MFLFCPSLSNPPELLETLALAALEFLGLACWLAFCLLICWLSCAARWRFSMIALFKSKLEPTA